MPQSVDKQLLHWQAHSQGPYSIHIVSMAASIAEPYDACSTLGLPLFASVIYWSHTGLQECARANCWHCRCRFPNGESGADVYDRMTIFEDHLVRDINAGALSGGDVLYVLDVALSRGTCF